MNKILLFCIPYAGGSAVIFNKWKQYLDPNIELIPVELAGRGRRIHEGLYKDVSEVTEDVFKLIKEKIVESPYALFGHSLGSMISYELAQKIRSLCLPEPVHIFFSGRSAPHSKRNDRKIYHLMNDENFKKEIIQLGGTPSEFFEHPELMELFIPFLKNDFRLAEMEMHDTTIRPFNRSITVFLGKDDDLTPEQIDGWKKHTNQVCNVHYFNGGHFFLHHETEQIVKAINKALN
jgi:medium-chain acyl-[acyl-carrier-protein] hydrolase